VKSNRFATRFDAVGLDLAAPLRANPIPRFGSAWGTTTTLQEAKITRVYELDALTPAQLANLLEEAILDVIDVDAYEAELAEEERDLEAIAQLKQRILGK
jgi:hypothetical protein